MPSHAGDARAGDPPSATTASLLPAAPPMREIGAHWLLVDKPAGWLVHPSALDAQAPFHLLGVLQHARGERLWTVHRLDKGTSGLLLLARSAQAAAWLGAQWRSGRVRKHYLALVRGWTAPQGAIDHPLAHDPERPSQGQPRREARTLWRTLARHELPVRTHPRHAQTRLALVQVQPVSGRRHQIRRHLKHLGHPLLGDATHGKGPLNRAVADWLGESRLWLHAWRLELPDPAGGPPIRLQVAPDAAWSRWWPQDPGVIAEWPDALSPAETAPAPGRPRHATDPPDPPDPSAR